MSCRLRTRLVCAFVAMAMAVAVTGASAEKLDHVHLTLSLAVSGTPLTSGDVLGLYAVETVACPDSRAAGNERARGLVWLGGVGSDRVRVASVSHRDEFERPGARVVSNRVRLDRAGKYALGRAVIPSGRYCKVRLTLNRLPPTNGAGALPALETSVRLSRPGKLPPMALSYVVALELPFAKPWQAGHGSAQLTMSFDPSAAASVLADASLSEGALLRSVTERWIASSRLTFR
jgi:hypothetical protein